MFRVARMTIVELITVGYVLVTRLADVSVFDSLAKNAGIFGNLHFCALFVQTFVSTPNALVGSGHTVGT